jgi:hypothetical protein
LLRGDGLSLTNPAMTESYRSRLMATTFISNLGSANTAGFNVQIDTNPGGGRGGTCFGDSGGPVLLGRMSRPPWNFGGGPRVIRRHPPWSV